MSVTDPSYTPPGSSTPVNGTTTIDLQQPGPADQHHRPAGQHHADGLRPARRPGQPDRPGRRRPGPTPTTRPGSRPASPTPPGRRRRPPTTTSASMITSTDLVRQNTSAAYTTSYGYNDAGDQTSQTSPTGVHGQRRPTTPLGEKTSSHRRRREHHHATPTTSTATWPRSPLPDGTATTASLRPGRAADLAVGPERRRHGAAHRVGRLRRRRATSPRRPTSWATPPPTAYDATGC